MSREESSRRHPDDHRQEDPERQVAVKERELATDVIHRDQPLTAETGLRARTKALMNLPSTCGADGSDVDVLGPGRNDSASSTR